MNLGERRRELIPGYRLSSDLNTLGGLIQVRRHIETRADTSRAQSGLDHGASRAFPIGPRHMHKAARAMRVAQSFEQAPDPFQVVFRGLNLVPERLEKLDGFLVIHPLEALLRTKMTRPASTSSRLPPSTFS